MLKHIFEAIALILMSFIIVGKFWVFKIKNIMISSNFVAAIAALFGIYSLLCLLLMFSTPDLKIKLIMLVFGSSPFLIGKMATYKLETFFTVCQVLFVFLSLAFVVLFV